MIVSLTCPERIRWHVFISDIPGCFARIFEATDSHTLALSNGVVHETLVLTDHLALGVFNRTGILF